MIIMASMQYATLTIQVLGSSLDDWTFAMVCSCSHSVAVFRIKAQGYPAT